MWITVLITAVFVFLCEGSGLWLLRILGVERTGYGAPLGFALILSVLQVFAYFPERLNAHFGWLIGFTIFVMAAACYMTIMDISEVKKSFFRKETLVIIAAAVVFVLSCDFKTLNSARISSSLLQNEFRSVIASPGVFNGLEIFRMGASWFADLISDHTVSFSMMHDFGFGLLYAVLSTQLIFNIIRSFHLRNHWLEFSLLFYMLVYGNYQCWHIYTASQGTAFSGLFITAACCSVYQYLKSGNEQVKYVLLPILGAGLASDGTFALAGIAILYGLSVYLFSISKIRSLFDLTTLLIPYVVYGSAMLSIRYGWIILVLYLIFCFRRYKKPLRRWISRSEEWCFANYRNVFLIGVPAAFAALSLILVLFFPQSTVAYDWYFQDFHAERGVRDYLLLHSNALDKFLTILRWAGVVFLFLNAKKPEDRWLRFFLLCMFIIFLNPLCTPALVAVNGPEVFRLFSVVFNPCTETIVFLFLYQFGEWNVVGQWILEIGLCLAGGVGLYVLFFL